MNRIITIAIASAVTIAAPVAAQTLASSNFNTGDQGWTNGDFDTIGSTSAVTYNASAGTISVTDNYSSNALIAPTAYLGNKSAAFGGTFSFQLASATVDGPAYSPLALFGAGLRLYAAFASPPAPTLTNYVVTLTGNQFRVGGDPFATQGTVATDAQLQAVLASLDRVAIQADWQNGADLVTLDNVVLAGPNVGGAVPEPATWAMMVAGFGLVGGAMRTRARKVATA